MLSQDPHTQIELSKFDLLREEVAFQTGNYVQDYYFTTQRLITIAAATIMNAVESVCNLNCKHHTEALIYVVEKFPFESYAVLLRARNRLLCLINEKEEEEEDAISATMATQGTRNPPTEDESRNASVEEGLFYPSADNHIYHSLEQNSLEQTHCPCQEQLCKMMCGMTVHVQLFMY